VWGPISWKPGGFAFKVRANDPSSFPFPSPAHKQRHDVKPTFCWPPSWTVTSDHWAVDKTSPHPLSGDRVLSYGRPTNRDYTMTTILSLLSFHSEFFKRFFKALSQIKRHFRLDAGMLISLHDLRKGIYTSCLIITKRMTLLIKVGNCFRQKKNTSMLICFMDV